MIVLYLLKVPDGQIRISFSGVNDVRNNKSYVIYKRSLRGIFGIHLIHSLMSLLTIALVLIIAGVLLWLVNNYIPMDSKIRNILNVVVVIVVIVWLLNVFGLFVYLKDIHI